MQNTHTATPTPPRIVAKFHPQAWQRNYAIELDPEGDPEFDVTAAILRMPRDEALAIRDNSHESDRLKDSPLAPDWIRTWAGPFYVEVQRSIADYFDATDLQPTVLVKDADGLAEYVYVVRGPWGISAKEAVARVNEAIVAAKQRREYQFEDLEIELQARGMYVVPNVETATQRW